jgi:hypothetical protein
MSDPDVTPADATARPVEETPSPAHPLALDPLGPAASRPMADTASSADPLALDPLGPIRRFSRAG